MAKVQVRFVWLFLSILSFKGGNLGGQNEPPHKKQRTSDGIDPISSNISPQAETSSMVTNNDVFEEIFFEQ